MAADYKVLTVKEVSKVLHVHPSTIYKLPKVARFQASESAPTGDSERTRLSAGWLNRARMCLSEKSHGSPLINGNRPRVYALLPWT